ncbi:MAG: hypothetical protein ACPHUF_14515 [Gammaproteobacteria bacterium]
MRHYEHAFSFYCQGVINAYQWDGRSKRIVRHLYTAGSRDMWRMAHPSFTPAVQTLIHQRLEALVKSND